MKNTMLVNYKGFKTMAPVISHRPEFRNFLVSNYVLQSPIVSFSYVKCGRTFTKVIPTMRLMEILKVRKFFKYDDDRECMKFCGSAFEIPEKFIFDYKED